MLILRFWAAQSATPGTLLLNHLKMVNLYTKRFYVLLVFSSSLLFNQLLFGDKNTIVEEENLIHLCGILVILLWISEIHPTLKREGIIASFCSNTLILIAFALRTFVVPGILFDTFFIFVPTRNLSFKWQTLTVYPYSVILISSKEWVTQGIYSLWFYLKLCLWLKHWNLYT